MCLILFAWQAHENYPLIVAANRDEFHARPTQAAHLWTNTTVPLIAGKDLEAGGTWMGITQNRRFAAVTNFREIPAVNATSSGEPGKKSNRGPSRGQLVIDYLDSAVAATEYARHIQSTGDQYAGFNLLLADENSLLHISNRSAAITTITPGVHGLSNASLNTAWPKVSTGKTELQQRLETKAPSHEQLRAILSDQQTAAPEQLPDTGVGLKTERMLSARKIVSPDYGTRSSSTLLVDQAGHIDFYEQRYRPDGQADGAVRLTL